MPDASPPLHVVLSAPVTLYCRVNSLKSDSQVYHSIILLNIALSLFSLFLYMKIKLYKTSAVLSLKAGHRFHKKHHFVLK